MSIISILIFRPTTRGAHALHSTSTSSFYDGHAPKAGECSNHYIKVSCPRQIQSRHAIDAKLTIVVHTDARDARCASRARNHVGALPRRDTAGIGWRPFPVYPCVRRAQPSLVPPPEYASFLNPLDLHWSTQRGPAQKKNTRNETSPEARPTAPTAAGETSHARGKPEDKQDTAHPARRNETRGARRGGLPRAQGIHQSELRKPPLRATRCPAGRQPSPVKWPPNLLMRTSNATCASASRSASGWARAPTAWSGRLLKGGRVLQ